MPSKSGDLPILSGHVVNDGRLRLGKILGSGAYGVCYEARSLDPAEAGRKYAVKCLAKVGLDARQRLFQRRELRLHAKASLHPNVITLHRTFEQHSCVFVVMDLADAGDLFGMITERYLYLGRDPLIRHIFTQIIDALEYCHSNGIFHRDLKPGNILCTNNGSRVLLADFGLATDEPLCSDFGCGSSYYMSPECYGGVFSRMSSYATRQNDTWALGVILVNLTCGRNPWRQACSSDETFRAYFNNQDFLREILPVSLECNDVLKRIFTLNPDVRISLPELRLAIQRIARFTMTNEELRRAPDACQTAARSAWVEAQKAVARYPPVLPAIVVEEPRSPIPKAISPRTKKVVTLPIVEEPPSAPETLPQEPASQQKAQGTPNPHPVTNVRDDDHFTAGSGIAMDSSSSASITVYDGESASGDAGPEYLHPLSAVSSASTAAESAGPTTPEWIANTDVTQDLPDIADEPLALDGPVIVLTHVAAAKKSVVAPSNSSPRAQTDKLGSPALKDKDLGSIRGMRDLWRKVKF